MRGAYTFEQKSWYVTSRLDLGIDYVGSSDVNEGVANIFGPQVNGKGNTFFLLQPAIEVGSEFALSDGLLLRSDATVGLTQFLCSDHIDAKARFTMMPSAVPAFTGEAQLDHSYLDLSAGLKVITLSNIRLGTRGLANLLQNTQTYVWRAQGGRRLLTIRLAGGRDRHTAFSQRSQLGSRMTLRARKCFQTPYLQKSKSRLET